jgi:tripartite-type tricarboxylate transporter receptor subunit TctC
MSPLPPAHLQRRAILALLGGVFAGTAAAQLAKDRPIQLYVGYPAGGGTDYVARLLAARMAQVLEQQVVVMNLPGATGAIALDRVAKAVPDGHSLVVLSAADTILPSLRSKLPFDLRRDLAPVAPAVVGALGLVVNPALNVHSVRELVALAKTKPGALNFASPGIGNSQHLAGETFNKLAGTRIVHVPFKGGAEAINAVISGDVQVAFASIAPALPLVQGGKLRLLAVTPKTRSAAVPDTPTIAEAGVPGYDVSTWFGVAAPAGTPKDVLQRLNAAIAAALAPADVRETLLKQGLEPTSAGVAPFTAFVHGEISRNAALVREIGLKAE